MTTTHIKDVKTEFMIESHVLQKLKKHIEEIVELLKKTVKAKQPIFIRHHADADGYTAGIALERALLPFIAEQHRRERDVSYHYQRLPSLTPYYSYEDATKDIQTFLRNAEQFEMKTPLIVLLDLGSGAENLASIQKVKIYGATIAVIDHHPLDEHTAQAAAVHINPHTIGSSYDYSAGMLCAEIGHLLLADMKEIGPQHFYFIAAVSGTADKVMSEEHNKYMAMASHHGFSKEFVQTIAQVLDYEAHVLGPSSGREIVQDILGKDEKKQHKLLALAQKHLEKVFSAQVACCLQFAEIREKKNFLFVKVPIEQLAGGRNAYPPRGKSIGLVQQHFADQNKKALVVGIGTTSFNFRCNKEIQDFDVNEFSMLCKKKFPYALITGGGHKQAGSIHFVAAVYKEMVDALEEYVDGLKC